jgi:Co/Zn/Cd efflux system component
MTALSHLVFFDVGSAAICVGVEVLGNFEVWKRSSVRHPFGLQRVEVLAGFAMSVFLVFGGFDLISHNLKHVLEGVGGHKPHHPHSHRRVEMGMVDCASLAAVVSTLISAYGLKNHGRIRRVMRVPLPFSSTVGESLSVLGNPFLFLTLTFSFLMLLLPLLSVSYFTWLDRVICAAIAVSMFVLGTRLAVAQGLMLLMSYSGRSSTSSTSTSSSLQPSHNGKKSDLPTIPEIPRGTNNSTVSSVVREIELEPNIARVDEAQFWQVHYGLAMANLKVCLVRGVDDGTLSRLRNRIAKTVNNQLGEGYGHGASLRWEVTVQTSTDK